ncbi:MAG: carbohydrate porin [Spirochaetes bacterium]|nr:carbohydrate porin [Spirochaetota bacterium]
MKRIKIFSLFIFLLLPPVLKAYFYGEIFSGIQLNHPTASSLASGINRLRLGAIIPTKRTNLDLHLRFASASGKSYFGSVYLMTPANDIASDPDEITLDKAYFGYEGKRTALFVGLIDPLDFTLDHRGFFQMAFAGNENNGFFSTHFLKCLSLHGNGTDQMQYPSIPSVFFLFYLTEHLTLQTGLTFGLASKHLFLRNTMPVEIKYLTSSWHISINAGFADADSTTVHKISPSWGILTERKVMGDISLFAKYNKTEKDVTTYKTPDITISDHFITAKEFGSFKQHMAAGITCQKKYFGFGSGYSHLKRFGQKTAEEVVEIFFRTRLFRLFDLSPDLQYIIHPNGTTQYKYMWIAGIRLYYSWQF